MLSDSYALSMHPSTLAFGFKSVQYSWLALVVVLSVYLQSCTSIKPGPVRALLAPLKEAQMLQKPEQYRKAKQDLQDFIDKQRAKGIKPDSALLLSVKVQDAGRFALEFRFEDMKRELDKQLRFVSKYKMNDSARAEIMLDAAEIYIRNGFSDYEKSGRLLLNAKNLYGLSRSQTIRRDLLWAQSQHISGYDTVAVSICDNYIKWADSVLNIKSNAGNQSVIQLKADFLLVKMKALAAYGNIERFKQAEEGAVKFFTKTYKGKTKLHFDFWWTLAKAHDLNAEHSLAKKYYHKAQSFTGGKSYDRNSFAMLGVESDLVSLLYATGKKHEAANRVVKVVNHVDKFFYLMPDFEALKSITIMHEYASQGDLEGTIVEVKAMESLETPTYQFSPAMQQRLNAIGYRVALQADSVNWSGRILARDERQLQAAQGNSLNLQIAKLNHVYHQGLFMGKWQDALAQFEVGQPLLLKYKFPANQAMVNLQSMYSRTLEENDKLRQARRVLVESQRAVKAAWGENHLLHASELEQLARVEMAMGSYLQAEDHLLKATEIVSRSENRGSPVYLATMRSLIKLYLIYGDYDLAEEFINYAIEAESKVFLDATLKAEYSDALEPLLAFLKGQYHTAEAEYLDQIQAAELRGQAGKTQLIEAESWLGQTYLKLGDYALAEKAAQSASLYAKEIYGDTSRRYYQTQVVLQKLYRLMGDYDRSEKLAERILKKVRRVYGDMHVEVGQALTELALVKYLQTDSVGLAMPLLDQARSIYLNNFGESHPLYAEALTNIAQLSIDGKQYDTALVLLNNAAAIYEKKLGKRPVQLIEILKLKGDLHLAQGQDREARRQFDRALELTAKNFSAQHPSYLQLEGRKARCYVAANNANQAIKLMQQTTADYMAFFKSYFPFLSEREKAIVWAQSQPEFNLFASLAIQHGDKQKSLAGLLYNQVLATKGMLLSNSQTLRAQLLANKDKQVVSNFKSWQKNKELLAARLAQANKPTDKEEAELNELKAQTDRLEKWLGERSSLFNQMNDRSAAPNYDEVFYSLKPGEYAVEIVRAPYFSKVFTDTINYVALILGGKYREPIMVELTDGNTLERKAIRYYRNAMRYNMKDSLSYAMFWKRLEQYLPTKSTLYFSAEGVYNQLNLAGLRREGGSYLADDWTVINLTSTRELIKPAAKTSGPKKKAPSQPALNNNALLVGNPVFYFNQDAQASMAALGVDLKPLAGTEQETEAITNMLAEARWSTKRLVADQAKEEAVKEAEPTPRVLHIATHGAFVQEEDEGTLTGLKAEVKAGENSLLKVGLVLAGGGELLHEDSTSNLNQRPGVLTAYEAMNMNLAGTELVVLSACETGLGHLQNGEGVYGLQRAFLVAGAKNVVFSLFKVDDKATTELMTAFYKAWLGGKSKRQAFAEAQLTIRKLYPDKPAYWSSFTMLGL